MFEKLSIRNKLIVLLIFSTALGLLGSVSIVLYTTFMAEKEATQQELHQVAGILSENMRAALAFHDPQSASNILGSLKTNPAIQLAFVEDESGTLLAEYVGGDSSRAEEMRAIAASFKMDYEHESPQWDLGGRFGRMEFTYHFVIQKIEFEGKRIGVLAIISDNDAMYGKMLDFAALQVSSALLILLVLAAFAYRLQHSFTRPIYEVLDAMRAVAKSKDHNTPLPNSRRDEFGDLYLGFNAMLEKIRERDEQLRLLATTDVLTGLANRRHAMDTMDTMVERSKRTGEPIGVILLDVDHFKKINDAFGHHVGDAVLVGLGKTLQSCARAYDLAVRWGGEEFLLLCDNADLETAAGIAERVRQSVAIQSYDLGDGRSLGVTVSLGVYSEAPIAEAAVDKMLEKADRALYRAKESGRNQVVREE